MAKGGRKGTVDTEMVTLIARIRETGGMACSLTPCELDIAELMVQGLNHAEISRRLCISVQTAQRHATKIRYSLGLPNRVQVTAWLWGIRPVTLASQ